MEKLPTPFQFSDQSIFDLSTLVLDIFPSAFTVECCQNLNKYLSYFIIEPYQLPPLRTWISLIAERKKEDIIIISNQTNLTTTIFQNCDTCGPFSAANPLNFVSGSEQSGVFPAIKPKSDLKMRSKEIYIYIIYTD